MKRHIILSLTLLISVALVAGCVSQSGINIPGFGSEVVKPTLTQASTGVTDVIAVEGVQTLPSGSILPDQSVKLFMNIVNHDTDPTESIKNVFVKLYDAPLFKNTAGTLCNSVSGVQCQPDQCGGFGAAGVCELFSGETKAIRFDIVAPSLTDIANIITRASLSWLVDYNFKSTTNYDILAVQESEILRLQQLGETLSASLQNVRSAGPLKIDLSMPTSFAIASKTQQYKTYVIVKIVNSGAGFTLNNKIDARMLKIKFPTDIGSVQGVGKMQCTGYECINAEAIDFFKKETLPMQIVLTPQTEETLAAPHRTFTVTATVEYTYELRGSTSLEVKPLRLG